MSRLLVALALGLGLGLALPAGPSHLPSFALWPSIGTTDGRTGDVLAGLYALDHRLAGARSVQGLEGYVVLRAPAALGLGLVGNVETRTGEPLPDVRSVQAGGIAYGPVQRWTGVGIYPAIGSGGSIQRLVMIEAVFPTDAIGDRWGIVIADPAARHRLAGTLEVDTIRFPNGWQLQAEGDALGWQRPNGTRGVWR